MDGLRQVIEEESFARAKDSLGFAARRLDEILEGLTWVLARGAHMLTDLAPGIGAATTGAYGDVPGFLVLYRYDDGHVYLLHIESLAELEETATTIDP